MMPHVPMCIMAEVRLVMHVDCRVSCHNLSISRGDKIGGRGVLRGWGISGQEGAPAKGKAQNLSSRLAGGMTPPTQLSPPPKSG